jgi:hypothetical protein
MGDQEVMNPRYNSLKDKENKKEKLEVLQNSIYFQMRETLHKLQS